MSSPADIKALLAPLRGEVKRHNAQIILLTEQLAAEEARYQARREKILRDIVDTTARRDVNAQALVLLKGLK